MRKRRISVLHRGKKASRQANRGGKPSRNENMSNSQGRYSTNIRAAEYPSIFECVFSDSRRRRLASNITSLLLCLYINRFGCCKFSRTALGDGGDAGGAARDGGRARATIFALPQPTHTTADGRRRKEIGKWEKEEETFHTPCTRAFHTQTGAHTPSEREREGAPNQYQIKCGVFHRDYGFVLFAFV